MESFELQKAREYKVVKSNTLIQQARMHFTLQQQKALLYIISQLKPGQKKFTYQDFVLADFCAVCGIAINGKNYADLKDAISGLSQPVWVWMDDDSEMMLHIVQKAIVHPRKGTIQVRIDEDMQPYLLELQKNYTKYELRYTLAMHSKYSVRLYELLRSWANRGGCSFGLDRLQELVDSKYDRWQDVKRKVLEPAVTEINELTDLKVEYQPKKKGRAVVGVDFVISQKGKFNEKTATAAALHKRLDKKKAVLAEI